MSTSEALVIGATGTVGGQVAKTLVERGVRARGASRAPDTAERRGLTASEWVRFDLERPETFAPALTGVDRVFLMARPGDPDPARVAAPLVEAMRGAGVRRVVNLTAMGAESRGDVTLGEVERLVEDGGFEWTHLRPNWFMQVFSSGPLLEAIRSTGRLGVPVKSARISFVDARDVAAVAVTALVEPGHGGTAYTLTGPQALDHGTVARILAGVSGRSIEYVALSEDAARERILAAGLGPDRAERLIRFYGLVRKGLAAPVTNDVEAVLGRPPISFSRFAADHAEAWKRRPRREPAHPASPPVPTDDTSQETP